MKAVLSMIIALVRPKRGFSAIGESAKWLWLVPLTLLVASAVAKGAVNTPLTIAEQQEVIEQQMSGFEAETTEAEGTRAEREKAEAEGEVVMPEETNVVTPDIETVSGIATVSAVVFAALGAIASIMLSALFFYVAAKVAAKELSYSAPLTVVGVMLIPQAIRNLVQTVYILVTGKALMHPGLGALVAPADAMQAPPASYAVLSQIDLWVFWSLFILFGGLTSTLIGLEKKRAWTAFGVFVFVVFVMQAVPTFVTSAFRGSMG